jgi:L-arabinose isomerase
VGEDILQRAKVGVFGIGPEAYWDQFDGLRDRLECYRRSVEERIGQWATVVSPGLVDTAPQAYAAAEGESLPVPTPKIGNTNSRLRFALPPAAFMNAWCEHGPTHHCALGVGHHAGTLRKVARLLGLAFVEVGRS